MTEYWKSNERHYCAICKCWMDSGPMAIRRHEEGKGHKENYINQQKALRKSKEAAAAAAKKDESDWAKLDAAAQAAYQKDLMASGGAGAHASSIAAVATPSPVATPASKPVGLMAGGAIRPTPGSTKQHGNQAQQQKEKPKEKVSVWQATMDPNTGATYYYNIQTLATSWTNPDAAVSDEKTTGPGGKKHARSEEKSEDGETVDGGESKKKQKLDGPPAAAAAAAPSGPLEIDEDTGLGKWETVAAPVEPTEPVPQPKKRMTPWGMIKLDQPKKDESLVAAEKAGPPVPNRYANLTGDDAEDADEDEGGAVDVAQQLRNQFGPSHLIQSKGSVYEPGADLLKEDDSNAAAPVVVTFKKKSNRAANVRQPVAASNN